MYSKFPNSSNRILEPFNWSIAVSKKIFSSLSLHQTKDKRNDNLLKLYRWRQENGKSLHMCALMLYQCISSNQLNVIRKKYMLLFVCIEISMHLSVFTLHFVKYIFKGTRKRKNMGFGRTRWPSSVFSSKFCTLSDHTCSNVPIIIMRIRVHNREEISCRLFFFT